MCPRCEADNAGRSGGLVNYDEFKDRYKKLIQMKKGDREGYFGNDRETRFDRDMGFDVSWEYIQRERGIME